MAQKIPGPWTLHPEGIKDADGRFLLWGALRNEVAVHPDAERLILAAPEMLMVLKRLAEDPDGFARFEAREMIRSIEEGT